jgi:subtilase family serine protease
VRKLVLVLCVVVVSGFLAVPAAHAFPPRLPPGRSKHVCNVPNPGEVRCHAIVRTDDNLNPLATNGPGGYGPADLRSAYAITANGSDTVAIVDAYGYPNAEADLATYRAQFGLPPCTTANGCFHKLNQLGKVSPLPVNDISWSQEQAVDLDMVSAICPGCKLILLEANTASIANLSYAVLEARRLGAHAISNSYGGNERSASLYASRYAAPGVAVTASNGDAGYGVEFPASSPYVIAVGGTSLAPAATARGWSEIAWSGTGSGCSAIFAKPSWQTDRGCKHRTVGDVSAVADPNTGAAVYAPGSFGGSGWYVYGGTSVAAPIIAAAYAINGAAVKYADGIYVHANDLNDVTSGADGSCTVPYLCTAEVGYDGPTGLGTPNGTGAFGGTAASPLDLFG